METVKEVVHQYDMNLCTKANKQEVNEVIEKFRGYIKKEKFKPWEEKIDTSVWDLQDDMKAMTETLEEIKK